MKTKSILIAVLVLAVLGAAAYAYSSPRQAAVVPAEVNPDARQVPESEPTVVDPNMKTESFVGVLEEVNVGCFVDGECYVMVSGKHVTTTLGWRQEVVGQVLGVESFGDLSNHIGKTMEVYAQKKDDGTYTLYGNEAFYIKLK